MKTNEIFDLSALIDERFGAPGTQSRIEAEEQAESFYFFFIIKEARKKTHITQAELARRIDSDRAYISKIENGKLNLTEGTFCKIMVALGGSREFFMSL